MDALHIAKALGGTPSGAGWLIRCPCSGHGKGHGDRRPSLSIADGDQALLINCFAGCDARDVLDELRHRNLIDGDRPSRRDLPVGEASRPVVAAAPHPEAQRLWRAATPASNTLVETYLRTRGLTTVPPSLRYASAEYINGRVYLPSMIAAVQGSDRSIIAVQYTFLAPDGSRKATVATPRRTLGMLGTGAVRLAAAANTMGLAEGVETGLAAQQLTSVPVWVGLGAARLHRVWIPDDVEELHVFADDDEPGRAAAERVAQAHAHRRVIIRLPPAGCGDWADALKREVAAA